MNPLRNRKRVYFPNRKVVNTEPKKCVSCGTVIGGVDLYNDTPPAMCFACPPMKDEPWVPTHSTPKKGE